MTWLILHVCHDSSHSATWLILGVTWLKTLSCVTWLIIPCDMTYHPICDMTHPTFVSWLLPQCNMTHSRRDMTHWDLRHDSSSCMWHDSSTASHRYDWSMHTPWLIEPTSKHRYTHTLHTLWLFFLLCVTSSCMWTRLLQCVTLQHTAAHCNTQCNTLQHTATHCTTMQHTVRHYNTLQHTWQDSCNVSHYSTLQHAMQHAMQHTATHCNTLHHTSTHINALQHTWQDSSNASQRYDWSRHT